MLLTLFPFPAVANASCMLLLEVMVIHKKNKINCWKSTYPIQLHVLKLEAKIITLDDVASEENLREQVLSESFRLQEKG